jgi:3-mercaptopyruvate sulfurtransferase SseA
MWTYDAPFLLREMAWLQGWGNRMIRMFGVSKLSVVDVRPADAYKQAHLPHALNIPADVFRKHVANPEKLAEVLGPAGVDAAEEAVIVSERALNPGSALAFLMLQRLGQSRVSVLLGSLDEWGLRGFPLSSPQDLPIRPTVYRANLRRSVVVNDASGAAGPYPKVFLASGKSLPARAQDGKVIHVPYTELLNAEGTPKAAKDIWGILTKAGVPRYAEIVCYADDPGEAAVNYFILKLMGYPDVKVLVL